MNTFWAFLFGLSIIVGYLFYFKNSLVRSLVSEWYEKKIVPKRSTFLNAIFQTFLSMTSGDMGNLIFRAMALVLAVFALYAFTKSIGMELNL